MANELQKIEADKVLIEKVRTLIETAKYEVAVTVNSTMTLLYWEIGAYINSYILANKRAEYGKQIVVSLSRQLQQEYGTNFSEKNLRRMMQFAERFPEKRIVVSLIRQLTWTHIIALIPIEDELKRNFYIEMCRMERWSVRTLRKKINSMLYERTAISQKPDETIRSEVHSKRKNCHFAGTEKETNIFLFENWESMKCWWMVLRMDDGSKYLQSDRRSSRHRIDEGDSQFKEAFLSKTYKIRTI